MQIQNIFSALEDQVMWCDVTTNDFYQSQKPGIDRLLTRGGCARGMKTYHKSITTEGLSLYCCWVGWTNKSKVKGKINAIFCRPSPSSPFFVFKKKKERSWESSPPFQTRIQYKIWDCHPILTSNANLNWILINYQNNTLTNNSN